MASSKTSKQESGKGTGPAADETENLHTLPDLGARLGEATESEVNEYIEGHSKADLIEEGRRIGTSRIDTDCARLYGKAADFFDRATEAQRDILIGVSPEMVRVAVWAAQQGSQRFQARERASAGAGASKEVRATEAELVRNAAIARRRSLRVGLRALAAGNAALLAAIDSAVGSLATPAALGDSLEDLVKVGRKMLKDPSKTLKARLQKGRLTEATLSEIEKLAKEVRATGTAAGAIVGAGAVSQAEVDYWDGINLVLLGNLMDVFEAGHEADQTIPRLVPIALRGYFSPIRRSPKAPEPTPDAVG